MTAEASRLDTITERLGKATPGPWSEFWRGHIHADSGTETVGICHAFGPEDRVNPNAEFIASAPTDVAYLLALTRDLEGKLMRVEKVRKELLALSNDKKGWTTENRAAYLDASRAIYTALEATP